MLFEVLVAQIQDEHLTRVGCAVEIELLLVWKRVLPKVDIEVWVTT
jgi:hypothetical protein